MKNIFLYAAFILYGMVGSLPFALSAEYTREYEVQRYIKETIYSIKENEKSILKQFNDGTITSYCGCRIKIYRGYHDLSYLEKSLDKENCSSAVSLTTVICTEGLQSEYVVFDTDIEKQTILEGKYKPFMVVSRYPTFSAHLIFKDSTCQFLLQESNPPVLFDNFVVDSCSVKKRVGCCCKVEKGDFSTRYYNCKETSGSLANCEGTLASDDTNSCVDKTISNGKEQQGTSNVALSVESLKERAKTLDVANFKSVPDLIQRAITLLMAFMGTILFALYIYAGLTWMTANGNEERITSAKNILVWSTLGVAVMMASYIIIKFIFTSLGK